MTNCTPTGLEITVLGFRISGTPKMVMETQILEQVFQPETQGLCGWWTTLYFGLLTENRETAKEIQFLRQVFRMEIQILIVISSPALPPSI